MKDLVVTLTVILILILLVIIAVTLVWPLTNPQVRAARDQAAIERSQWINLGFKGMVAAAVLAALAGDAWLAGRARAEWFRAKLIWADRHTHTLPAMPESYGMVRVVVDERAYIASGASSGLRPMSAGTYKAITAEPESLALPAPEAPEMLATDVPFDARGNTSRLIAGETGGGKTTIAMNMVGRVAQEMPNCEFVILEPGGANWGPLASAYTNLGIAQALQAVATEFRRRQDLLRTSTADHILDLPGEPLPFVYLVFEEAELWFDNMRFVDTKVRQRAIVDIRDIVRAGRKTGMGCLFVTQAALADVFDSHLMINLTDSWLSRGRQQMLERFDVPKEAVHLPSLRKGQAYSVTYQQTVAFPIVPRPNVRVSPLYQEAALPPTPTSGEPQNGAFEAPTLPGRPVGDPEEDWRNLVWETWLGLPRGKRNYTRVQGILFPGQNDGGRHWEEIKAAVLEMRRRHNWQEPA